MTAIFVPSNPLSPDAIYSAVVTTEARDLAGNPLVRDFVWSFKTGTAQDATRPTVSSITPASLDLGVVLDRHISVTFNEMMNPRSLNTEAFTLEDATGPILGTVTVTGATVVFAPAGDLAPSTSYTARITTAAGDLSGNPLAEEYVSSFTTRRRFRWRG